MADLTGAFIRLAESIVEFPEPFLEIVQHDPLNAIFLALGALFVGAASLVFGFLSLGAFVSFFTADV